MILKQQNIIKKEIITSIQPPNETNEPKKQKIKNKNEGKGPEEIKESLDFSFHK